MDVRILAAALLGLSTPVLAATNAFSALGPNGGSVNQITFSLDGSAAYMAAAGGFYRSANGGTTWSVVKSDFMNAPWDVAIDPADPSRLYVASVNAPCLWVSTDGGKSLTANASLPAEVTQVHHVAVSHDGATIYVSSFGRIFASADRGQNWQERTALSTDQTTVVSKLLVDPSDPATLYASASTATTQTAGIFVTRNGGSTWQQLTSGPGTTDFTPDLAINPANPQQIWSARYNGVWVSADRGAHWSNLLSASVFAIAVDPASPTTLYTGTGYGKVYRSTNGGTTWSDVTGSIAAGENLHLAINASHPAQLLAGGNSGVSGSRDSGATWTAQQSGFAATSISGFSADPSADRIYVHAPVNGIFFATASGLVQPVDNAALLARSSTPSLFVTSILAQPGRLFASVDTGLTSSADGGSTWAQPVEVLPPPWQTQQVFLMASGASTPQNILAATYGPTLMRSTDRGATWSQAGNGLPANATVSHLLLAPSDASIAYGSFYLESTHTTLLGIYKSIDAGVNWVPVNADVPVSPTNLLAVDPSDAKVAYGNNVDSPGATQQALLKTVDGGAHWSVVPWDDPQSVTIPNVLAVDPAHPYILYGASNTRIARSVDGGASWETLRDSSLPFWAPSALIADPRRPESLLAGTIFAGVQQITIAPDLALQVAGPGAQVALGSQATYRYTATNLGPFDATGVRATVHLPAAGQTASAAVSSGTGSCAVTGLIATCAYPVLRKGAIAVFTVTTLVHAAGDFNVTAAVAGEQPDADTTNNSADAMSAAVDPADLSVTMTGTASATVGDAVSFTVTASNAGPGAAAGTQLAVQIASGLTLGAVSSSGAGCTTSAGQVSCDLGSLSASSSVTVTVNATAAASGAQAAMATVTSSTPDTSTDNNSVTVSTTIAAAPAPAPPAAAKQGGGGQLSMYELALLLVLVAHRRSAGVRRRSRIR